MSFVGSAVALASAIGGAVVGNQQKQKMKGQAAQAERDSAAAQAAADAKLKAAHTENIDAQSEAAGVARNAVAQTPARNPDLVMGGTGNTLLTRPLASPGALTGPSVQPVQRKTLMGS